MRLPGLLIVLALLLLPSVSAGSERDPDVRDRRGDVPATNVDILSAWFEGESRGLRFHIQTADGSMPDEFPDVIYWFLFTIDETGQEAAAVVGFGNDGVFRGHLSTGEDSGGLDDPNTPWSRGTPYERAANGQLIGLRQDRGLPSTWSGVIPWGSIPAFESGVTLTGITIGSTFYDRDAREWTGAEDRATRSAPYVAERPSGILGTMGAAFPILVPAWMLPTIVVACTAAGLGAGYALARRAGRAPAKTNASTNVPVRAAPPPPGARFQRAPPAGGNAPKP